MSYELAVETDSVNDIVRLRLTKGDGAHCGSNQVELAKHRAYDWEGLFDTRRHVRRYRYTSRDDQDRVLTPEQQLEAIGVFLGEQVLGEQIMDELCKSRQQRTLLVRLPATAGDVLATLFARVPWELARPAAGAKSLMARQLVVRVVTQATEAGDSAVRRVAAELEQSKGVVKVLLMFAEAPGSRPLAMRLERERLRQLFETEILPRYNVRVDVLCHGVTLAQLREQITKAGGYHIVHWSGHGHHNQLELRGEDDSRELITGEQLVALIEEAGGFVPQLFFLSACLSGAMVDMRAWNSKRRQLRDADDKQGERSLAEVLDPEKVPGYTGTALALLRSGVPQVVAMRYSVSDGYARELAWWFYKRLLADGGKHTTEAALALARNELMRQGAVKKWAPVDHANPLVFGQPGRLLDPVQKRSKQTNKLRPKPQPLLRGGAQELERPSVFVGRGAALIEINRAWQPGGAVVTVLQGMAGLGKTVLAAEALHLWHDRFDWVLAFQAKPTALSVEDFLRQVDLGLLECGSAYRDNCGEDPTARVYLESRPGLEVEARYQKMLSNLVEALRDEAILIVLDNFETNLETVPREGGYACADPRWDTVLRSLSTRLSSARSRVLMTTRHQPKALSSKGTRLRWLGPLPANEAVHYIESHDGLEGLRSDDDEGAGLVKRLLDVSRGHPLILDRLAALAGDRAALSAALDRLASMGLATLPDLAVALSGEEAARERAYLEDVAKTSVDILIERTSATARRLLWVVTLANEPVDEAMLAGVWAGRSEEDEQMQRRRMALAMRDELPEETREQLDALPPELLDELAGDEPSSAGEQTPEGPLLAELHQAGLLSREAPAGSEETREVTYGFHELVRERMDVWMVEHPGERGQRTVEQVWVAYGKRYADSFEQLNASGVEGARGVAAEHGRRALVYLVRARDFEGLGRFASWLVTGTKDPVLLGNIIAELRAVAEQVPAGQPRWHVRTYLADALDGSGRSDEALPLFEQAVDEAEQAEHWTDVAWISGNWAVALVHDGQLDASKATRLRSAEADRKAGRPRIHIIASELEALRIDVMQGHAVQAQPHIEAKLNEVRSWWTAHANGEAVPEARDPEFLGRVFTSGLGITSQVKLAREQWQDCLDLLEEIEEIKRALGHSNHELAITRSNRYGPLLRLARLDDAQAVLEGCLHDFRNAADLTGESKCLSGLAQLWDQRGDLQRAADLGRQALAVCNHLPDPEVRAISHSNLANYLGDHPDSGCGSFSAG